MSNCDNEAFPSSSSAPASGGADFADGCFAMLQGRCGRRLTLPRCRGAREDDAVAEKVDEVCGCWNAQSSDKTFILPDSPNSFCQRVLPLRFGWISAAHSPTAKSFVCAASNSLTKPFMRAEWIWNRHAFSLYLPFSLYLRVAPIRDRIDDFLEMKAAAVLREAAIMGELPRGRVAELTG